MRTPHVMTLNSRSIMTLVDSPAGEHPGLIRSSSNKLLSRLISVMRQQDVSWPVDLWQGVGYIPRTHYCASFFLCTVLYFVWTYWLIKRAFQSKNSFPVFLWFNLFFFTIYFIHQSILSIHIKRCLPSGFAHIHVFKAALFTQIRHMQ